VGLFDHEHIEIKYHFIRDMVQKGAVKLQYISRDKKIVKILTKSLSKTKVWILYRKSWRDAEYLPTLRESVDVSLVSNIG
jgi:hypothetical protein